MKVISAAGCAGLALLWTVPTTWAQEATADVRVDPTPPVATSSETPMVDKSQYSLFSPTPVDQMRPFATDRPNKSSSPYTVDAGHFQYEMDLLGASTDGYSAGHTSSRTIFTSDPVLKMGITNHWDLELAIGGFQALRTKVRGAGPATSRSGYGDTIVRSKFNIIGNDGGDIAVAVIPFIKVPTASEGLGNNHVEGGVTIPVQWSLPWGFTALYVTEFDALKNGDTQGYHAGFINLLNLSHAVTSRLSASAEIWSQVYQGSTPSQATLDLSMTYMLTPNTQLDAATYIGMNKFAPDLVGYAGISQRF